MLFNHQLPFFVVYSMSSSCNRQITLWPCLHVFYSTSDQFISGFDSYMSTMVIFPDKLFSRLFQDYNPSTSSRSVLLSIQSATEISEQISLAFHRTWLLKLAHVTCSSNPNPMQQIRSVATHVMMYIKTTVQITGTFLASLLSSRLHTLLPTPSIRVIHKPYPTAYWCPVPPEDETNKPLSASPRQSRLKYPLPSLVRLRGWTQRMVRRLIRIRHLRDVGEEGGESECGCEDSTWIGM